MVKLIVHQAKKEDVYKDVVRVSEINRKNEHGDIIKSGKVGEIKVSSTGGKVYAILRGTENTDSRSDIYLDETLRENLGIECNTEYNFLFEESDGWWSRLCLAWNATDPGYKISIRIAVILGVISVLLGIISVIPK